MLGGAINATGALVGGVIHAGGALVGGVLTRASEARLLEEAVRNSNEAMDDAFDIEQWVPTKRREEDPPRSVLDSDDESETPLQFNNFPEEEGIRNSNKARDEEKKEDEIPVIVPQPTNENDTNLDTITGSQLGVQADVQADASAELVGKKKGDVVFGLDGKKLRGTGTQITGVPKESEDEFRDYLEAFTIITREPSSMGETVNVKKKVSFSLSKKDGGGLRPEFLSLIESTGLSEDSLKGKLNRAKKGNFPKFV